MNASNFMFALNGVLPLFLAMSLGYISRAIKMADRETFVQMNHVVFRTFLPLLIYLNIYRSDILNVPLGQPIFFAIAAVLVIFFAGWAFYAKAESSGQRRSVLVQALFRSNYVLFGVPLANALLPEGGSGITEILIAIVIPLFNLLAVFILQYYSKTKMNLLQLIKGIVKNPLIIASVLGLLTVFSGLQLPAVLETSFGSLAGVATPLALFALGGQFYFSETRGYLKQLIIAVSGRLLVIPLLALGAAVLLGMRGEVLVSYLALFGGPVAVSSYTMAQQMKGEHELAGQILVYTSIGCIVTLFFWISLMRYLTWI